MSVKRYLQLFFEEKKLEHRTFLVNHNGAVHIVESDFLQDLIINHTPIAEQERIRDILVEIDLYNGDVNRLLEHLAEGYIMTRF